MKKKIKLIMKAVVSLLLVFVFAVVGYVSYILITYSRIEDNEVLSPVLTGKDSTIKIGEEYTALTYNIGFGAYTPDFTFFMDGGKESWAESEESVKECINGATKTVKEYVPDFILLQEVDFDSTRSYHIDQRELLKKDFSDYSSVFAVNYHSAFLMYPFNEPHGASNAGILTFSRFNISSALRRSLPISESLSKFLDLDRCYSISRIPAENGKELVLFNVHLSAYGGSDEIRAAQMNMLFSDMKKEYDMGNYCVTGGDFNHDFTGDSTQKLNGGMSVNFGWAQPFPEEMLPLGIERCISYSKNELSPTCRNCDVPYEKGNFTLIVDGFLVSENVEVLNLENIDTGFLYSDHNPVVLKFRLK